MSNILLWSVVGGLFVNGLFLAWVVQQYGKMLRRIDFRLAEVERKQGQGSKIPDEAVARLSDPDTLDAELERAGELSDLRRARRRHKIRENAGPPATIRRIRFTRK